MKIWMRRIVKARREGFEGEMVAEMVAALNHYANGLAEWCKENVPRRDLPLAIAAMESALGMMKEVELDNIERKMLEATQKMTAVVAVKRGKEQE